MIGGLSKQQFPCFLLFPVYTEFLLIAVLSVTFRLKSVPIFSVFDRFLLLAAFVVHGILSVGSSYFIMVIHQEAKKQHRGKEVAFLVGSNHCHVLLH